MSELREFGYAEIIEEARLVTKGCIKSFFNGKVFAKVLFSLKAVNEPLEHLLLEVLCKEEMLKYTLQVCLFSLIHVIEVILMQL